MILDRVAAARQKAAADPDAFAAAVQGMAADQLKADALRDVTNVGLTGLGVGVAGRGLLGLVQTLRANREKKTRSGPAYLPLPFPAEKAGGFLGGDAASSKSGVPWYGPAMLLGGMGGLAAGWKGLDAVLAGRRKREQKAEIEAARNEFHDALMSQYAEPVKLHPKLVKGAADAGDATMREVGRRLDALFAEAEKVGIDWGDAAGKATGAYGMYAGLSGLLAGSLVYDKINKRSRRAVLEKALQRRQRRRFMQQPTQIMAIPEPVSAEAPSE